MSRSEELNYVSAKINDKQGKTIFEIFGKYTEELFYKNI